MSQNANRRKVLPACCQHAARTVPASPTCTAMRDSRVEVTPFSRMNRVPGLRPAMPYTVKQNTRAEMIWKGVVAATLAA